MIVEWIEPDEKGRFCINGMGLRIKESEKSKYFKMAMRNYPRAKFFTYFGIVFLVIGIFIMAGIVGHMEMISVAKEVDTWSTKLYIILSIVSLGILTIGGLSVARGIKLCAIYDRWIDNYFE